MAASMRMSLRFSSARRLETSSMGSRPNALAGMKAMFWLTVAGVVLADRPAPLHALVAPLPRDLGRPLADADADRRQRQAAGVQRGQRDLQAVALAADQVLRRDEDVLQQGHRVLDAAQAHEGVA